MNDFEHGHLKLDFLQGVQVGHSLPGHIRTHHKQCVFVAVHCELLVCACVQSDGEG